MSVDQPGSSAPNAPVNAPREGGGPKRPPRPERRNPDTRDGAAGIDPAVVAATPPGFAPAGASIDAPAATAVADRPTPDRTLATVVPVPPAPAPADDEPAVNAKGRRVRRGRRVKRVVRRIDLWSVLKLSLVVYTCLYLATLATLAALWGLLYQSGNVDKLQSFLEDVGLENFTFYGNQMFRACAAIGAVGVMAGTVITVLATSLINIISETTGGIRLVVIEEDVDR